MENESKQEFPPTQPDAESDIVKGEIDSASGATPEAPDESRAEHRDDLHDVPLNPEQVKERELHLERFSAVAAAARGLIGVISRREQENFVPLMDAQGFGRLRGAISAIDNAASMHPSDPSEMAAALRKLASSVDTLGQVPRDGQIHDDPESLGQVMHHLEQIADATRFASSALGDLPDVEEARSASNSISRVAEVKWQGLGTMRRMLSDYLGR